MMNKESDGLHLRKVKVKVDRVVIKRDATNMKISSWKKRENNHSAFGAVPKRPGPEFVTSSWHRVYDSHSVQLSWQHRFCGWFVISGWGPTSSTKFSTIWGILGPQISIFSLLFTFSLKILTNQVVITWIFCFNPRKSTNLEHFSH